MLLSRLKNKFIRSYFRKKFYPVVSRVRNTPELSISRPIKGLAIVSMVQKKDVDLYLVALKSFVRFVCPEKIILVADPTIDESDIVVLREHVSCIEIVPVSDFKRDFTPSGGCWERLNALSYYNKNYYVIQLDSDTTTHNIPEEVIESVKRDVSFTLGTFQGQKLSTLDQASNFAKSHIHNNRPHIQLLSEFLLNSIKSDLPSIQYYVRGCAGFNGFPKGTLDFKLIADISKWFEKATEGRWKEWGSEQFTCNLLVANIPGALILPIEKYQTPKFIDFSATFYHFIGSMRFNSSMYARSVAKILEELNINDR